MEPVELEDVSRCFSCLADGISPEEKTSEAESLTLREASGASCTRFEKSNQWNLDEWKTSMSDPLDLKNWKVRPNVGIAIMNNNEPSP